MAFRLFSVLLLTLCIPSLSLADVIPPRNAPAPTRPAVPAARQPKAAATPRQTPPTRRAPKTRAAAKTTAPKAPKAAPKARAASKRVVVYTYDVLRKGSKVGSSIRTETRYGDGRTRVVTKTSLSFRAYLLFKVSIKSDSRCEYDSKGKLRKFSIDSSFRGKKSKIWGTQTAKGITIHRLAQGKKPSKQFFAASKYDVTNLELSQQPSRFVKKTKRRLLMVPRRKIGTQTIQGQPSGSRVVGGQRMKVWTLSLKNPGGTGTLIVNTEGRAVKLALRASAGAVTFLLRSRK